jgi:hypothetical protein
MRGCPPPGIPKAFVRDCFGSQGGGGVIGVAGAFASRRTGGKAPLVPRRIAYVVLLISNTSVCINYAYLGTSKDIRTQHEDLLIHFFATLLDKV